MLDYTGDMQNVVILAVKIKVKAVMGQQNWVHTLQGKSYNLVGPCHWLFAQELAL